MGRDVTVPATPALILRGYHIALAAEVVLGPSQRMD